MTPIQYAKIGGMIALVIATWAITASYKNAVWQERLTQQYNDQLEEHNQELQTVIIQERDSRAKAQRLELAYHDQAKVTSQLAADNRRLADELGGLRDPYSQDDNSKADSTSCPVCKPCSGKLSAQATKFLLELTEEADRLRVYADTCYRWVTNENLAH